MKKIKIENKKLQLNKSKIADLSQAELANIKGGEEALFTSIFSCHTDHGRGAPDNCSGCQTCCNTPVLE